VIFAQDPAAGGERNLEHLDSRSEIFGLEKFRSGRVALRCLAAASFVNRRPIRRVLGRSVGRPPLRRDPCGCIEIVYGSQIMRPLGDDRGHVG